LPGPEYTRRPAGGIGKSIVNVGYRSTNFWVVSTGRSRFLVDLGWPGMFGALEAKWMKPGMHYTEITPGDNTVIPLAEGRALLRTLGIDGEFVHTPGHSDDSVSLVLDDGAAFTGDLTWPTLAGEGEIAVVTRSWELLRSKGAKQVYAGHGPIRGMP